MTRPAPRDLVPPERPISRNILPAEVEVWAKRIRVRPKQIAVRAMRHKWGSCSTAGRVTFDADLLRQHPDFRNRVIVEELLHLRVPNHGKLFKKLLTAYLERTPSTTAALPPPTCG